MYLLKLYEHNAVKTSSIPYLDQQQTVNKFVSLKRAIKISLLIMKTANIKD
ncbi:hypothetical protein MAR621_02613 [Maribacter dokdonensis]|nr:hypothetical protein MAR621_02613 [Maribacter dokdonensis]